MRRISGVKKTMANHQENLSASDSAKSQSSSLCAPWGQGVRVCPVSSERDQHIIHAYFNASPESPDGRWVLYFASITPEGHEGEIHIVERSTSQVKILARNVTTEDAHRVACQQWISQGRQVVFHDLRDGVWMVVSVNIDTLEERVLATGRQLAWGQPATDIVPLYGPHWAPDPHRNLELLNVETGQIRTAVTAAEVKAVYPTWISRQFGDGEISVFFPCLSPDLNRVFFKLATPAGGDFRSKEASIREGLICYDLRGSRFLFLHERWGHPAWHPDSCTIINTPNILIDADTGASREIPGFPHFPGSHSSISPDGLLFTTETRLESFGGPKGQWGIVVGSLQGQDFEIVHRFENTKWASSWRPPHPHPVFSHDGKRLYFNVSTAEWTQLYVAERTDANGPLERC